MATRGLPDCTPLVREAVRLYTDPLSPTFGNKMGSAMRAGASHSTARNLLSSASARAEIERIEAERAERGRDVANYLSHYAPDAARALVQAMGEAGVLELRNPLEAFDGLLQEVEEAFAESDLDPAIIMRVVTGILDRRMAIQAQITKDNRVAVQAAKERREAVETILAYHIGPPVQKIKLDAERKQDGPVDLSDLPDEALQDILRSIEQIKGQRDGVATPKDDDPVEEADWSPLDD